MIIDLREVLGKRFLVCPFHADDDSPSLAVYESHGFCFGCSKYVPAATMLELKDTPGVDYVAGRQAANTTPTISAVNIWHRTLVEGPRQSRLPWLYDRLIWPTTVSSQKLGHNGERFVIPVWSGRELLTVKYRLDPKYCDPDDKKYLIPKGSKTCVYRPQPMSRQTVICEGEFDALVLLQYGYDAVTSTGGAGSLAKTLTPDLFSYGTPLFVMTDQDDAGEQACKQLQGIYGDRIYRVRWAEGKDVTEALKKIEPLDRSKVIRKWIEEAV